MIKSLAQLGRAQPGFDPHNLLMLAYRVPQAKYRTGPQQTQFHNQVVESIGSIPGVVGVTSVRAVPLGGNGATSDFYPADRPEPPASERSRALVNFVDPHYFATMRIPVIQGRAFTAHDEPGRPFVVVINETLARRYFNGRSPIGQSLRLDALRQTGEIVGVVGDTKQFTLKDPQQPQIYGALAQNPFIFTSLAVRTVGDPLQMVNQIRRAIWKVDKDQPVWSVHAFEEVIDKQSSFRRLITGLLAAYAVVALVLSSIGIFGVVSYAVSQRTAEIGVRMALGARSADVAGMVIRQALFMTASGAKIGLGAATWLSRYLRTQLYAVTPLDTGVYASMAALIAAVAIAASIIPACRAAKVDPVVALRYE
jgi:putative ABC transport system permease protein